jgi:HemN C-terminal region.
VRRLDAYVAAVAAGRRPRAGREHLVGLAADAERVVLGLRRAAGVVAGAAGARLVASAEGRRLMAAGLLERREDRLVVRDPLLTDVVSRAVLSVCSGDC